MKLFIARHGEASFQAASDHDRPLTENGIAQTKALVAKHWDDLKDINAIWASPLVRAQQTAQIYADALHCEIQTHTYLTPDAMPKNVLRKLSKAGLDKLLVVSHQPLVGDLASLLVEGNIYCSHPYATSEVLVFEYEILASGTASIVADYLPG